MFCFYINLICSLCLLNDAFNNLRFILLDIHFYIFISIKFILLFYRKLKLT